MSKMKSKPRSDEVAKLLEKAIDRKDIERIVHWVERRGYHIKDSELPSWFINGFWDEKEEIQNVTINLSRMLGRARAKLDL